jgi:squalene cyclase
LPLKPKYDPIAFILRSGDVIAKAKLHMILGFRHSNTIEKSVATLKRLQNPDGGFRHKRGRISSVRETLRALSLLLNAGISKNSNAIKKGVEFLWSMQRPDFGWSENPQKRIPKWQTWLSDTKSVTWLTTYAADTLCKLNYNEDIRIKKAFNWTKGMQASSGLWPDFEGGHEDPDGTSIIVEALLDYGEAENSPIIKRAIKALLTFLEEQVREERQDTWNYCCCLPALYRCGYTLKTPVIKKAIAHILRLQRPDGGWSLFAANKSDPRLTADLINDFIVLNILSKKEISRKIQH